MLRAAVPLCWLALATIPATAAVQTQIRKVHLGPIATGQSPYVYLPFDVPSGAQEIVLQLDYDRADGDNAIDFGIFDARFSGRDDDLTGYRGKNPNRPPLISVVGRKSASYGHLDGPMPAGVWRVMFYVYKTRAAGVDVSVSISIASEGQPIAEKEPRWFRGDLHVHTLNSDGLWTVSSAAAAGHEAGLDFLAITDHNVASQHYEIEAMPPGEPLLMNGIELTTYGGHMNVWGVPTGAMIEHRQPPGDNRAIQRAVDQAHRLGARISINHPFASCKACDWAFDKLAPGFDSIEVWNGPWSPEDQLALNWWQDLLRSGRHITAIGSSDSHGPQNEIGVPTLHLYAQRRDVPALLGALAGGRAVITASPGIRVDLEASYGNSKAGPGEELAIEAGRTVRVTATLEGASKGQVIVYSASGEVQRWPLASNSFRQEIDVPASSTFYRLEARDENGSMIALTNPVWIQKR